MGGGLEFGGKWTLLLVSPALYGVPMPVSMNVPV
jgi:hypothetical protein